MVLSNQRDTCSPRGTLTTPNLQSVTRNCMNHPSQRERQSSRKQSRRRFWCPVVEYHKASGSGRQHNQVIQPEDHVTIVINSPPPLELFPQSLILHREIGTPLHLQQPFHACPTVFSGIRRDERLSLSHRSPRPVAVASRGCRPCPSSSLGGHHSHNNPSCDSQSYQDTSRCGNSYKWPSCAGSGRETSDKGKAREFRGERTNFASTPARLFPPVDFTSLATKRSRP